MEYREECRRIGSAQSDVLETSGLLREYERKEYVPCVCSDDYGIRPSFHALLHQVEQVVDSQSVICLQQKGAGYAMQK